MVIALTVAYDGRDFCGWQVQPNGVSVQSVLEKALFLVTGKNISVTGSGRTDAGVHALGQVASFEIQDSTIPPNKFSLALNCHLPSTVRVLDSRLEKDGFNARKSAVKKTYCYSFYYSKIENPLLDRYALMLETNPDLELMQSAGQVFVGEHDFKCFNASGGGAKTTVREIYDIKIRPTEKGFDLTVTGNGFLYNMVRTMAGTLLEVGLKKKTKADLLALLQTGDRSLCGKTLPAKALCLVSVEY